MGDGLEMRLDDTSYIMRDEGVPDSWKLVTIRTSRLPGGPPWGGV